MNNKYEEFKMKTRIIFIALLLMSIGVSAQDFKYESIWSMYSEKKLSKMPKYNIEEAESFSTIQWKEKTQTITISTSSPDGENKTVVKVTEVIKEGKSIVYKGIIPNGKMTIAISPSTKWIVITNMQHGNLMYEYHKIM
jgi:hypothetical protein